MDNGPGYRTKRRATHGSPNQSSAFFDLPMMTNHFIDDEPQEFLGENGIELRIGGQFAQPLDLLLLAARIGGRKFVFGLEAADCLRDLEPFCKHIDQSRVDIIDALPILFQRFAQHALLFAAAFLPHR